MMYYDYVGNSAAFLADVRRRQSALLYQYSVAEVVQVADEPIDLETARAHCRVDTYGSPPVSDDDAWLLDVGIPAAREYCEAENGRSYATRTLELISNAFPSVQVYAPSGPGFYLPLGPVQSVESVTYKDTDGVMQTVPVDDYQLDSTGPYTRLVLGHDVTGWPTARNSVGSVRVRYVTGHTAPGESPAGVPIPARVRAAILLMLCHLYDQRSASDTASLAEIPIGVAALLAKCPREDLGMA